MDVGCGSGFALCELAEKFPSCSFVGVDLLADAIEAAKGVHRQTLTNILRQQTPSLSPSLPLSLSHYLTLLSQLQCSEASSLSPRRRRP